MRKPFNLIQTVATNYYLPLPLQDKCFVWQVTAICEDGTESPVSTQECYGQSERNNPRVLSAGNNGLTSVFPNPSNGKMTIVVHTDYDSDMRIELYDMLGHKTKGFDKNIQIKANRTSTLEWDGSGLLAKGVYFIRFHTSVETFTKTIIIE